MDPATIVGDALLASRVEDAGLNACATPQQLWVDGWLVRLNPGKAKRARCVNALADGRLTLGERLARVERLYADAGLPLVFRITPFTRPATLDAELAARGFARHDDTRVMIGPLAARPEAEAAAPLPAGLRWIEPEPAAFAALVGRMRGTEAQAVAAHARRLAASPVPFNTLAIAREADGAVVACGQSAREGACVGLYDVYTDAAQRGNGLGTHVCERLLRSEAERGATIAYLQVDAENASARRIYHRLGLADAYAYHYRHAVATAP